MRVRPAALLVAVFGTAAAAAALVVLEVSREARRTPLAAGPAARSVARGDEARAGLGADPRSGAPAGPPAALHVEVVRPGGGPAPGAELAVHLHETARVVARATSGTDGRAVLDGLAPGAYDVRAAAAGASPALVDGVTLSPGDRFPLRIALAGTGSVEGIVRDPSGRALAGVEVRAASRGDPLGSRGAATRTDFEGRFRLDGLTVGRAEIVAASPGVLAGAAHALEVREGVTARADLVLPQTGVLSGRIRSAEPAGTAVVAVAMAAGPLQVARADADASGAFRLALPAGEYRVHAARGEGDADHRTAPAFARVEPGRTSRLDLDLRDDGREEAVDVLVREPGGAPSPGAIVTLARADDGRVALATAAGPDGRVAIGSRMGIAGARVAIHARSGGRTGTETLVLPSSGTVEVRLSPAAALDGVIRGAGRVSGFTLEISAQPEAGRWRTLDVHRFAGDRFSLGDLPAEPLRLVVRALDGRHGTLDVRLAPGERRVVEIPLR